MSLLAIIGTIFGAFMFFSKSDSAALLEDDALAEDEAKIDDRIEELENQDEVEHKDPSEFWRDL